MTVHKYPVRVREAAFPLTLPRLAAALTVQNQDGQPCLWMCVGTHQPTEVRWFRWYGTGHDIDVSESPAYVGTVQMSPFVWHLFEVRASVVAHGEISARPKGSATDAEGSAVSASSSSTSTAPITSGTRVTSAVAPGRFDDEMAEMDAHAKEVIR